MTPEQAKERANEIVAAHTPASFRATAEAVRLRDRIAAALLAEFAELRAMLRDCAGRLHTSAMYGGNARWAVEALVKQFLDQVGTPMPPWPAGVDECGRGFAVGQGPGGEGD